MIFNFHPNHCARENKADKTIQLWHKIHSNEEKAYHRRLTSILKTFLKRPRAIDVEKAIIGLVEVGVEGRHLIRPITL